LFSLEIVSPSSSQVQIAASTLPVSGSGSRTGTVPKTITFDKTAERGDRVSIVPIIYGVN